MAFRINTGLPQAGLAAGQMIGSAFGQLGGSIGGMLTRGGEAIRQGREAEKMAGIYAPTAQAGATSTELFQSAQQLMSMGKTAEGMAMAEQARAMQQTEAQALAKEKEQADLLALQESIASSARRLNLPDVAERALNTTDPESLRAIQKDLRQQEVKDLIRERGEPARKALARNYGITYESYMGDLSEEGFFKLLEGQEAELKSFVLPDGTETLLEVNKKDGKVRDPSDGVFKRASELGLRKAPNRQQVENIANYTNEKLAEAGVKRYDDLATAADDATRMMNNITEVMPNLDEMITGKLANAELFVRSAQSAIAAAVGLDPEDPKLANTQTFLALAAPRVANIIKDFGAGTGLSDADREFATLASAGDITMTATALRNILKILKNDANRTLKLFENITDDIRADEGKDPLIFYRIPALKSRPSLEATTPAPSVEVEGLPPLPPGAVLDGV